MPFAKLLRCARVALPLLFLGACGGSDPPTTFNDFIVAAQDAESTARRLAEVDLRCTATSDCAQMQFGGICYGGVAPLSLRSAAAPDALAALAEQQRLMQEARRLDTRPPPPCAVPVPHVAACVQSACTLVQSPD